jgi:HK97 family phage major capsid protein
MPTMMKKSLEDLEAAKAYKLAKARDIADTADAENREFTKSESRLVQDLVREVKEIHGEILERKGQRAMLDELSVLGTDPVGPAPGKALGSGVWAKALTDSLGAIGAKSLTPSGSIHVPAPATGLVATEDRPRNVLGLIPSEPLTVDSFVYLREVQREHNASTVAVGKRKPVSQYGVEKIEDRARTVAHLSEPVPRQDLADSALLGQYLEGALRAGVELTLEDQVINGNGATTGVLDDMVGVRHQSGLQVVTWAGDMLTTARRAVTNLEELNLPQLSGVAWMLNPTTWEALELLESPNHFVMGGAGASSSAMPVDRSARRLWGYRVITSTVVEAGVALLGDWAGSIRLRPREDIRIDWSDAPVDPEDGVTAFEKNLVVFRGEGRFGLEVLRPAAFVEVELVAPGS